MYNGNQTWLEDHERFLYQYRVSSKKGFSSLTLIDIQYHIKCPIWKKKKKVVFWISLPTPRILVLWDYRSGRPLSPKGVGIWQVWNGTLKINVLTNMTFNLFKCVGWLCKNQRQPNFENVWPAGIACMLSGGRRGKDRMDRMGSESRGEGVTAQDTERLVGWTEFVCSG